MCDIMSDMVPLFKLYRLSLLLSVSRLQLVIKISGKAMKKICAYSKTPHIILCQFCWSLGCVQNVQWENHVRNPVNQTLHVFCVFCRCYLVCICVHSRLFVTVAIEHEAI